MRKQLTLAFLFLAFTTFFISSYLHAQQEQELKGEKIQSAKTSIISFSTLSRLPQSPDDFQARGLATVNKLKVEEADPNGNRIAPNRTGANYRTMIASPTPSQNYIGLPDGVAVGTGTSMIPPDTHGAVGLDKVMVTLNNNVSILNKANGATISTVSLNSFWSSTGATGVFDPKMAYDPINDRWIFVAVSNSSSVNSSIVVGVSQTNNPSGSWTLNRYIVGYNNASSQAIWADFPCIGFNKNWIAVSVNMFNAVTGGGASQGKMLVIDYPALRSGTSTATVFSVTESGNFCMSPAITYSPYQDTLFAVGHIGSAGATYALHKITGSTAAPFMSLGSLKTNSLGGWTQPGSDILPQAPEPGPGTGTGTAKINSTDAFVRSNSVYRNGFIYYTQAIGLPAGGTIARTAVQWTKINTAGNFVEGGRVDDPTATATSGKWYNYPSIDVNLFGDVLLGFSQFAANQPPSAGYVFRSRNDAEGTMRDPFIYKTGQGHYHKKFGSTRNRWGDYSITQVDPADQYNLWTLEEYSSTPVGSGDGSGRWGTWWAKVTPPDAPGLVFQSLKSGNWNSNSSWQSSTGGNNWIASTATPSQSSYGNNILNGHTITVNANLSTDQTVVQAGGSLVINSGQTLTLNDGPEDDLYNFGTTTVNGNLANNGTVAGTGTFKGSGTITTASFINKGSIAPGNSTSMLTITGNYVQAATGTLTIELGGATAGTQYDRLNVSGTATLNGTLNVSFINGFTPTIGQSFTILDAAFLSGTFTTLNLPASPFPYVWATNYDAATGNVVLTVTNVLPVRLLTFSAQIRNADVVLNWKTATEENHDRFEIERSIDGVRFEQIGSINALPASNSVKNYNHSDDLAVTQFQSAGKLYYRLKIVGVNSDVAYSLVVPVSFKGRKTFSVSAQPNPFTNQLLLNIYLSQDGDIKIKMFDALGKLVKLFNAEMGRGFNSIYLGDFETYKSGTYLLQVQNGNQLINHQLMKIK
jgi:hypothetical protein